jgi:DNA-binding NtrC family response regulator
MGMPLKLLLAEDNPDDATLLIRALVRSGFDPEWKRVEKEADFLSALHPGLDIVISDFAMPEFTGLWALQLVKLHCPEVPFIIVSGTIGEETAVEAMRHGAMDYLMKDRLARLGEAVHQALENGRLRRRNQEGEQKMREQLAELLRWQEIMLGREERVQALKMEVNALLARLHEPPRYRQGDAASPNRNS